MPLEERFGQEFTPLRLIESQRALGREIGMVVDLTFTAKYYSGKSEFEERGIRHKKIMVCSALARALPSPR